MSAYVRQATDTHDRVRVTSPHMKHGDLSAAVGFGLINVRETGRLRQQDVADAAAVLGLPWTQATVAAVEAGRRKLSLAELMLVAEIVHIATLTRVTLVELITLGGTYRLSLTPVVEIETTALVDLFGGAVSSPARLEEQALRHAVSRLGRSALEISAAVDELHGRGLAAEVLRRVETYGDTIVGHRVGLASHFLLAVVEELRLHFLRAEAARGEHVYWTASDIGPIEREIIFEPVSDTSSPARSRPGPEPHPQHVDEERAR